MRLQGTAARQGAGTECSTHSIRVEEEEPPSWGTIMRALIWHHGTGETDKEVDGDDVTTDMDGESEAVGVSEGSLTL